VTLRSRSEVSYCRLVTIQPTTSPKRTNTAAASAPSAVPFRRRRVVQKDLDIAESPTRSTIISPRDVLEPGLVVYKVYTVLFLGRPTVEELRQDLRAVTKKCRPTGTSPPRSQSRWHKAARSFLPLRQLLQTIGEQD